MDRPPRWRIWLRHLAPWVVTGLVIAFLLRRYELGAIADEIVAGDAGVLVPWALAAGAISLLTMGTADWLVLRDLFAPLRWRDVVRGKGGTGVLAAVSYGVGHGGYGLWIARTSGAGARAAVGAVAYIMLSDLTSVGLIASVTLWWNDLHLPDSLEVALRVLAPLGTVALIAAALTGPRLVRRLLRDPRLARPWAQIPARVYLLSLLTRCANAIAGILVAWAAARGFGLEVPLRAFLTYLPIVFLVGSLPINVGGLGAVQLVWLHFFTPWAPAEQILAFQFLFSTLVHASLVVRGLPFVSGAMADIDAGGRRAPAGTTD